jgi:hypothetical protein
MRKFRFRGKSIKDGEWVEGYFAVLHIPVEEIIDGVLKRTGYKEVPSIFNDEPGNREKGGYWHDVMPATVNEFTGFYDQAGKPIFEGDIVEKQDYPHLGRKRTVIFNENGAFMTNEPEGRAIDVVLASRMYKGWCVIGNIIDNPGWAMED